MLARSPSSGVTSRYGRNYLAEVIRGRSARTRCDKARVQPARIEFGAEDNLPLKTREIKTKKSLRHDLQAGKRLENKSQAAADTARAVREEHPTSFGIGNRQIALR